MNRISILLFQLVFFAVLILPATSQDQPKDQATEKAKAKAKAKIAAKAKAKQAGNPRPFQRIVIELDANMNMMLERSEVPKEAQKQFDELLALMDKNGDKALDRTELQAAGERIQKIFGGMPPSGNAPTAANTPEKVAAKKALAKKAMARKEAANLPDPIVRIRRMDKDGDGVISREEWVGQPQGFNRADTNSDGKLDAEEQSRAAEIMKRFIEAAKKKAQDN
jgi:Ca2+-binding EF-hand superfamily protein